MRTATFMCILSLASGAQAQAADPPSVPNAVIAGASELWLEGTTSAPRDARRIRPTGLGATIGTVLGIGLTIGSAYAIKGPDVDFGAGVTLPRNGLFVGISLSPLFSALGAHLGNRWAHGGSQYPLALLGSFTGTALGAGAFALVSLSNSDAAKILTAVVLFPTFQVVGAYLGSIVSHRRRVRSASQWTPSFALVSTGRAVSGGMLSLTYGPSM